MYLGIDGGGSKTAFALVDHDGTVRARHESTGLYYPEIGLARTTAVLAEGVAAVLARAQVGVGQVRYSFIGLPAYGEDSSLLAQLDLLPSHALPPGRYRCGNDVECGWAGSLCGEDGISVVAGTGSIAYGEFGGRRARVGGWGELFSDEGSAYWIAREGLALFSRMSDGRAPRAPLYELLRARLNLAHDLDLCAHVYGRGQGRADIAELAPLVGEAAHAGDGAAGRILEDAAAHLVALVRAAGEHLAPGGGIPLRVSYSGGVLENNPLALRAFHARLAADLPDAVGCAPAMAPALGAALLAARSAGHPLNPDAVRRLAASTL